MTKRDPEDDTEPSTPSSKRLRAVKESDVPAQDRIRCTTCFARRIGTYICPDCQGRGWLTRHEFAAQCAKRNGRPAT